MATTPPPSFKTLRRSSRELDAMEDAYERALQRHHVCILCISIPLLMLLCQSIERLEESQRLHRILSYIYHQIEYLKFARDWNSLTSRKEKTAFFQQAFFMSPSVSSRFRQVTPAEQQALIANALGYEYKTWRRRQERFITACNRVLDLYRKVITTFHLFLSCLTQNYLVWRCHFT